MKHFKINNLFFKVLNGDFYYLRVDANNITPSIAVVERKDVDLTSAVEITEREFYNKYDEIATELEDHSQEEVN